MQDNFYKEWKDEADENPAVIEAGCFMVTVTIMTIFALLALLVKIL